MELRCGACGYVSLADTHAQPVAEDEDCTLLLRPHHVEKKQETEPQPLLYGLTPTTSHVIYNPSTLQDLADIFGRVKL